MEHVRLEPVSAERCIQEAERLRSEAQQLPPGPQQQELIRKARQTYTAAHLNEQITSRKLLLLADGEKYGTLQVVLSGPGTQSRR